MPTASGGGHALHNGGYNDHPAGIAGTPPQRGTLARDGTYQVPLHWRGGRTPGPARRVAWVASPGWLESSRKRTYSPFSSRAKRGDPVNKKVLRAYRPQTLSTLYTLHSTLYYSRAYAREFFILLMFQRTLLYGECHC